VRRRSTIIDGDFVQLRSRWRGPDDEYGYLLGEADERDKAQRVYAFGQKTQNGSVWQITRI
jgi:hypothetical protein